MLPSAAALECQVDALTACRQTTLHAGGCFGLRSFRGFAPTPGRGSPDASSRCSEDEAGGLWAGGEFAGGNVAHFAADGTPLVDAPVTDGPVHTLAL